MSVVSLCFQAMVANGPAQKAGLVNRLLGASEVSGDPLEHSKLRREVSDSCQSMGDTCQLVGDTCRSVSDSCQSAYTLVPILVLTLG